MHLLAAPVGLLLLGLGCHLLVVSTEVALNVSKMRAPRSDYYFSLKKDTPPLRGARIGSRAAGWFSHLVRGEEVLVAQPWSFRKSA